MPNIVDPSAINFCNTKIRPMADAMAQSYYTAKSLVNSWNALVMSGKIPNDASLIVDGAAQDGRQQITGAQATSIITRAQEIITDYEAGSNAKLNTVHMVGVNTAAKF